MGEISDEETLSRLRTPSEEYGSAGLGYGVVDRPKSAGPPTIISNNENNIGFSLGCREVALSRREEYESASLGHGVVDRPKSAGPPTTISNKLEDHSVLIIIVRTRTGIRISPPLKTKAILLVTNF